MTTSQSQPLPPGVVLSRGKYTIEKLLGQGGFGYVYLSRDRQGRVCAVKQCTDLSSEGLMQFGHEVAVTKILNHPAFVRVYAQFVEKVTPANAQTAVEALFTVMEYVPGRSLDELLVERLQANRGPFAQSEAVAWIGQLLDALEHAHHVGVIHRDIKPANLLLLPDGKRIKVIDFGIAKIGGSGTQTLQGARGVSSGYSPPEQYSQNGQTDKFSDIYAVGATLYHLVTGQPPVDAPVRQSGCLLIPPRQHNPALSPAVEAVILQAMQLNVADRFQSAAEMSAALHGNAAALPKGIAPAASAQFQLIPSQPPGVRLEEGESCSMSLELRNTGATPLVGSMICAEPWLKITPTAIDCAPGGRQPFHVIVDASRLAGYPTGRHYSARLLVQTDGGSRTLVYPLQVMATPRLLVTPLQLDWGKVTFRRPAPHQVCIENTGTGRLQVNLYAPVPWLQITPSMVMVGAQEQQQVAVDLLPALVESRGRHDEAIRLTAGPFGATEVRVSVELAGPVVLSAAPRRRFINLAELLRWCDGHWQDAVRLLRSGELAEAIQYLCKPTHPVAASQSPEPVRILLDKVQRATILPDDNLALETVLRALGAQPPRLAHNWREIERKLGMGWRPDLRWLWPWWGGPGQLTFVVQNRGRGYLHGRVNSAVPWLEIRQPHFGCLAGRQQRIAIRLQARRRLCGPAPEILVLQVD